MIGTLRRDPRSMLRVALLDDDDLVNLDDTETVAAAPPIEGWTPEVDMLASVIDRLSELIGASIAAAGGKPPRMRPFPRPNTAYRRAIARRSRQRAESIVAEVNAARERQQAD